MGADRIDLAAGFAPFIVTPFLVLAPLVLLLSLLRAGPSRLFRLRLTPPIRRQVPFLVASSLFLFFSFASIPFSLDPERSTFVLFGLMFVATLACCISFRVLAEPAQETLIVRSVTFAVVMYGIFCVGECIAWSRGVLIIPQHTGSWLQSTFGPATLGPWAPMLPGTTFDNNRAGFILTMQLALLDRFAPESSRTPRLRFAIGLFVLLTLSRSAILCWAVYYLSSKAFWKRLASRRAILFAATIAISLVFVIYQREIADLAEAWEITDAVSTKLSMDPGSSGESHILLIERGFTTWLRSTKTIIAGIGFAAAPKVLEDFFGPDKHANFHCLYITALAETGFPSFVALMFILGYPIIGRKGAAPGIAAIMVFNVSYQSHMEAVFWLTLALLWSCERRELPGLRTLALAGDFPEGAAVKGTS